MGNINPVLPDGTEKLQELLRWFFDRFAGTQRCISSMTALPPKSSQRKKTRSHSWHFRVGTQSKVSGSFRRDIFRS